VSVTHSENVLFSGYDFSIPGWRVGICNGSVFCGFRSRLTLSQW
jgi:hypothetical protein